MPQSQLSQKNNLFAINIHGASMYPEIEPGDVVVVDPDMQLSQHCICYAVFPSGPNVVRRYFKKSDGSVTLQEDNRPVLENEITISSENLKDVQVYRVRSVIKKA